MQIYLFISYIHCWCYMYYFILDLLASSTPSSSVKDDDCKFILLFLLTAIYNHFKAWKVTAIVSLTLCLLFVLSWIILIIVLCCCKFKMKGDGEGIQEIQCCYTVIIITILCILAHGDVNHK